MRLLLATGNPGKIEEYARMLAGIPGLTLESFETLGLALETIEDGDTFRANALKKAKEAAAAAGMIAMADDSGLEVDALDGAPGVRSARWAGDRATAEQNNRKLLEAVRGVAGPSRGARFRCVIAVVDTGGEELAILDGTCEGRIANAARGEHGFGYDPVFLPEGCSRTMAELSPSEKDAISHRARATEQLVAFLQERLGE